MRTSVRAEPAPADTGPGADYLRLQQPADSALRVELLGRLEFKGERTRNDRCLSNQLFSATFRCTAQLTPQLDFQFNLRSGGTVADRVRVDVDYDSQREFDGSNNISLAYEGRPGEVLQRVEVGNVSFAVPPSRFITAGIPSGNYGVQASAQLGPLRVGAIAAQQKGNVVRDQVVMVGGRTAQVEEREIQDYQIEPRRFFFVVDPAHFGARYPNVDILDPGQMAELALSLPDTLRPTRVFLYRLIIGGQPPNPNGPRFTLLGDPNSRPGQVYELLREGVDYYIDPSLLWVALVRPLSLQNERLVAAWTLRVSGRDTTIAHLGGTPDLEFTFDHPQFANLIWEPSLLPDDPAFRREIRSVYRLGGDDVRRETVSVRLVAGAGSDQEKAPGISTTYLELFGLAQRTNRGLFDADNRLWPRPADPNFLLGAAPGAAAAAELIRDHFIVFPSAEPFSRRGLARPASIVANDTIYRTPGEYLYSAQHPQSFYRLRASYETRGAAGSGTIALAAVQIRPGSERLTMDGRQLARGVDYAIDYDLGRVQLLTLDTLSVIPRRVAIQFEENPLFTSVPTSVAGLTAEWALPFGGVSLLAVSQAQRTTFTRPPLGYEPQEALLAGLSGTFGWTLGGLTRGLSRWLPSVDSAVPSRLDVQAEVALSRPRQSRGQQAYVESFEGEGGITVNLLESQWQISSQPALGSRLPALIGAETLDTTRASTLAFQNHGTDATGRPVTFSIQQIDPQTTLPGGTFAGFEQILWLTLYPLSIGGQYDPDEARYRWRVGGAPAGRRWRSVRTALGSGGSGADLTRAEHLEFWTLVDTAASRRGRNPVLVLDFGDVSENRVAFAPESLRVVGVDSAWTGKQLQGFDQLDSERDRFSRAFSADVNDLGLPGHKVNDLHILKDGIPIVADNFPRCRLGAGRLLPLGDARINCTVGNSRLDEEDIDQDNVLNFTSAQREHERLRRFHVDLADPRSYNRVGRCDVTLDDLNHSNAPGARLCWVQVRIPFNSPDDSTAGGALLRRVRALRVTVVSGVQKADEQFTLVPLARMRVAGAFWLKRSSRPLRGLGGEEETLDGYVIASSIGTQDRDSLRGLFYDPPPGVTDQPEQQGTLFGVAGAPINERSMRLLAGDLARYARAETYFRFPEGDRNVMAYRELRLWARGRGRGWGPRGDLELFIKIGRDANNFYAYHTPIQSGSERSAWEPEVRVQFARFQALRARLQEAFLRGDSGSIGCAGVDSALIASSGLPPGTPARRLAACDSGYVVYTIDAATTPPNLAAVQELAAGIVRVDSLRGPQPPLPGDTLEVWIDDVRLADPRQEAGYAGVIGATFTLGDAGSIRLLATHRDGQFRQLGERPSFLNTNDLELSATWRLDKFLPQRWRILAPLTVTHTAASADPDLLTGSDLRGDAVRGLRTPRSSTTSVALSVQPATRLEDAWYAPLLNPLRLTASWNGAGARSEYQSGRTRGFDLGLDYLLLGNREAGIGMSVADSLPVSRPTPFSPRLVRVSTSYERESGRSDAFLKPAVAQDDVAERNRAEQKLWHNSSIVELEPYPALTARWEVTTLRDLRDYGMLTPNAVAASQERASIAGLDVGLERQRTSRATLLYAPQVESWLRPRLELSSGYSMLRDPNAPTVPDDSGGGAPRLLRRFGNNQRASAAALVNVAAAAGESILGQVARAIGTIDLSVSRDQLTAFDAAPLSPSWRYQFGVGAVDAFREIRDVLAASAGAATTYAAGNMLTLPFGATVAQRVQYTASRHWSRRRQDRHSLIDGEQLTYPDVTVRWSGQPLFLGQVLTNVGASVRLVETRQAFMSPSDLVGGPAELRATRQRSFPASLSASVVGNLVITAGLTRSERTDSLPGSVGDSRSTELSADVTRSFPLPRSWELRSGLRTRLSYQQATTQSYVSNIAAAGLRSRLTDNGRRALTFNADTDLADNLTFSLQGSRVVTFDRNFNRRFTQTVISAVLNIQFFGGALR